jgi:alpha-ketoglutarate-dependent taurine dioxygenase
MLKEIKLTCQNEKEACEELVAAWKDPNLKVFAMRSESFPSNVKEYYEGLFKYLGTPIPLAEDVNIGDRSNQRTGQLWMEVRYDPKHPDAYRHSANAQPLHTDASYVSNYSNATWLACVANSDEGGETTFIDSKDIVKALEIENPALLKKVLNVKMPHARSGDFRSDALIGSSGDDYSVNWNFYCISPDVDDSLKKLASEYFNYLSSSPLIKEKTIAVKLFPGDAVTWKDNFVLHGRNSFVANKESERFIWKCSIDIGEFN